MLFLVCSCRHETMKVLFLTWKKLIFPTLILPWRGLEHLCLQDTCKFLVKLSGREPSSFKKFTAWKCCTTQTLSAHHIAFHPEGDLSDGPVAWVWMFPLHSQRLYSLTCKTEWNATSQHIILLLWILLPPVKQTSLLLHFDWSVWLATVFGPSLSLQRDIQNWVDEYNSPMIQNRCVYHCQPSIYRILCTFQVCCLKCWAKC